MSVIDSTPESSAPEASLALQLTEHDINSVEEKTMKVWLLLVPSLCFIFIFAKQAIGFSVSPWVLIPSISLLLASGSVIWYFRDLYMENSPPLQDWKKLGAISDPEQFHLAYAAHVAPMSLNRLIDFYEEGQSEQLPFKIAAPKEWKEKLREETKGFDYSLLMDFPLQRLFEYELIQPDQFRESFNRFAETTSMQTVISEYEKIQFQIRKLKDFSIPEPLHWKSKLEKETAGMKYQALKDHYSLPDLIHYSLITPEELARSFNQYAHSLSIYPLIDEYEHLLKQVQLLPHFALPFLPEWKTKFTKETAMKKASEITENAKCDLHKLFAYKIISEYERQLLQQTIDLKTEFAKLIAACEKEIREKIAIERAETKNRIKSITESLVIEQKNLFTTYSQSLKTAETLANMQVQALELRILSYEKNHSKMTASEKADFDTLKTQCQETCVKIRDAFERKRKLVQQENQEALKKIAKQLVAINKLTEESARNYDLAIKNLPQEIERLTALSQASLKQKLAEIDLAYKKTRSLKIE